MKAQDMSKRIATKHLESLVGGEVAIHKWIRKNVRSPKNNCFFYSASLATLFPELRLVKGRSNQPGETAHFFVLTKRGRIIDPTRTQYDQYGIEPDYTEITPVSVERNLDYLVKHPLFKTLDKKDQEIINSAYLTQRF